MIEFKGQPTDNCARYILRRNSKIGWVCGGISAIIFSVPTLLVAFSLHWICAIFIPLYILVAYLAGLPPRKKDYDLLLPSLVSFNIEEQTIVIQSERLYRECFFSEVERVVDIGDGYFFYFNPKFAHCICQKNLLSEGTLEEFEALFADKIERA